MSRRAAPRRPGLHRLGLGRRLTAAFALGALLLTTVVSAAAFTATRTYLVSQREASATGRTVAQAQTLGDGLRSRGADPGDLLSGLRTSPDARLLLRFEGRWYGTDVAQAAPVPDDLRRQVDGGIASRQRVRLNGVPSLVVGVPLQTPGAQLYEIFSLEDLDRTLHQTSRFLLLIALLASGGAAVLGRWTSRRLLRPLDDVITTSRSIAAGRLDARLPASRDPDVVPFVDSFNAMTTALQERIDREARFAADVSHELRSPLTTLSTAVSVLQARRAEFEERAGQAVDLLGNEVERFERLVQDLLEISRLDAGHPFEREPVELARLVLHSPALARCPDAQVVVDAEAADLQVLADKRRLERVLSNLLDNAARYGGGTTSVRVEAVRADPSLQRVRLVVQDSGPGVPPEDRTRIFERFSRGSAGNRAGTGGVGLGLALVYEQVVAHDGTVWVENGPAGGARFVVELPAAPSGAVPVAP